jgi:hypothetical protein
MCFGGKLGERGHVIQGFVAGFTYVGPIWRSTEVHVIPHIFFCCERPFGTQPFPRPTKINRSFAPLPTMSPFSSSSSSTKMVLAVGVTAAAAVAAALYKNQAPKKRRSHPDEDDANSTIASSTDNSVADSQVNEDIGEFFRQTLIEI